MHHPLITRLALLALTLMLAFLTGCAQKTVSLIPGEGNHQFPYFKSQTPVWSYNDQIPGPLLRGTQGTRLDVTVTNQLKEPTSVHWHGLRIDNAMDGVPEVTQDPIKPGETFTYRLDLEEAGTFWYHPHFNSGEQLERGLKGPLIVDEVRSQPWSRDLVWMIDDWRMQQNGTIYPHFNIRPDLMHDGRWGNIITVNGKVKPDFDILPGERIRLRLINGANARVLYQSLPGLNPVVIAVDGRPVSNFFPFKDFILSPGNRVDLDITIPKDAGGKTFILEDRFTRSRITLAQFRVKDEKPVTPPIIQPELMTDFIPPELFDGLPVAKTWHLNVVRGGKFGIGWAMNQRLWPNADTADFKIGEPIVLKFVNQSTRLHPMHIHGAFFRVLKINGIKHPEAFTRDTVLVGPRETIEIGLVPEHKGVWMAHCHIQAHAESGMMTTIEVE